MNLSGVFYCCHAVLPHMRARGAGTIITIASWAARNLAWFPGAAYNASKRALLALTETLNLEVVGEGLRATVILPEAVDTPILRQRPAGTMPPAEVRAKMLRPEDVARRGRVDPRAASACLHQRAPDQSDRQLPLCGHASGLTVRPRGVLGRDGAHAGPTANGSSTSCGPVWPGLAIQHRLGEACACRRS